jgi:hypothetical protein
MRKIHTILLSIAGTILSAATIVFFGKQEKEKTTSPEAPAPKATPNRATPQDKEFYKTAGIKKAELKELSDSSGSKIPGFITGSAEIRPDEHDKYNVDILNEQGKTIGHIEKNRRLYNSLEAWHSGSIFAFVKITQTEGAEKATGTVHIPAGLNPESIIMLKQVFEKLSKRTESLDAEDVSPEQYLEVLNDHKTISKILLELDLVDIIDISLSKRIIPTLSKQLEDEQNWDGLLQLEKHSDLIDELSERFAGTTYRRISKAKKNTGQKN